MKTRSPHSAARGALAALVLLASAGAALAHPGHPAVGSAEPGLLAGFAHPLGLDHLLAMVAVGLWSAIALPAARRLQGPAAFLAAMVGGALLGRVLGAPALVEPALALSVVALALLIALPHRLPAGAGLALALAAGGLHGVAHGAELPAQGSFAAYAFGFVATTALLHAAGLGLGQQLRTLPQRLAGWSTRALALGMSVAGLVLLVQR